MLIEVPRFAGKTDIVQLADLPKVNYDTDKSLSNRKAVYTFHRDSFKYEFVLNRSETNSNRIFVLFSGDAMRSKYDPPVFQRWSWADKFPGHCVYVSDPSLYLHSRLGLAWYSGTAQHEPMSVISDLIREIAGKLNVNFSNIVSYGSSGGGFAALRFATFFSEAGVVAVNPQTDITNYSYKTVEQYLKICLKIEDRNEALRKFPGKLSLLKQVDKLANSRIVYVQNRLDEHHHMSHFLPFMQELGLSEENGYSSDKLTSIIFEHEGGHIKAETSEVFTKAMSIVSSWH